MRATGVLYGQVLAVFGIVIAGVWGATQWVAHALGYQPRLGAPWFELLDKPVYHPWRLFDWWFFFDAYAPQVFLTGGAIAGASGLMAVVVAIGMSIWRSRMRLSAASSSHRRYSHPSKAAKASREAAWCTSVGRSNRRRWSMSSSASLGRSSSKSITKVVFAAGMRSWKLGSCSSMLRSGFDCAFSNNIPIR